MAINLLDESFLRTVLGEIEGIENRDRKIQAWSAYNISHGDVLPYVQEEVRRMLPQSWKQMRISDISLSEKIISKVSQSYKEAPLRAVQENETDSENLSNLYEEICVNEKMDEFDFIFNLNRYALLWINYKEDSGIQFLPLHPFEFDVLRNADGLLEAVILSYPDKTITHSVSYNKFDNPNGMTENISSHRADASEDKEYAIWTSEQHVLVRRQISIGEKGSKETRITYMDIDGNPNNINPLGILPFVYLSKDDGGNTKDYPVPNPITRQSVFYNVLKSDELSAASLQGFGIRIISGTPEILNSIQKLHEGLTTAVELPQPSDPNEARTTLTFERPGPDLSGQRGSYDSYLSQVLSQHGINAAAVLNNQNDQYKSGLDRIIANADVQGIIKQNQNYYTRVEQKAFDIVKVWSQLFGEIKFSQEAELQIIYPRPQVLISDKETLENIKMLLDLGLIQKHEALMKLNPNLKEADAIAKIKEIDEEKNAKAKQFLSNGINNPVKVSGEEDGNFENPNGGNKLSEDLQNVPPTLKEQALNSIGTDIVHNILDYLEAAKSPVDGKRFPKLSEKYAAFKGSDVANLNLEGDLWNSIGFEIKGNKLIVGVDSDEEGKADGHNNFSGKSNLPQRQFIPDDGEEFIFQQDIIDDVVSIYEQKEAEQAQEIIEEFVTSSRASKVPQISLEDIQDLEIGKKIKVKSTSSVLLGGITEADIRKLLKKKK